MTENYRIMKASELRDQYIKIIKENGSDSRLKEIQKALEKYKVSIEWPEDEIEEAAIESGKYKFYFVTILFIMEKRAIVEEFKNVLIKIPNKEMLLLETKKLTSQDLKFLKASRILPWEN